MAPIMATMMLRLMAIAMVIGSICASPIVPISDRPVHTYGTYASRNYSFVTSLSNLVSRTHATIIKTSSEGPWATGIHAGERPISGTKPHHGPVVDNDPNKVIRAEEFTISTGVSTSLALPSEFPTDFVSPTDFPTHLVRPAESQSSIEHTSISHSSLSLPTDRPSNIKRAEHSIQPAGAPAGSSSPNAIPTSIPPSWASRMFSKFFGLNKDNSFKHGGEHNTNLRRPSYYYTFNQSCVSSGTRSRTTFRPGHIGRAKELVSPTDSFTRPTAFPSISKRGDEYNTKLRGPSNYYTFNQSCISSSTRSRRTVRPTHIKRAEEFVLPTSSFTRPTSTQTLFSVSFSSKPTHTLSSVKHTSIPTSISSSSFTKLTERPSNVVRGDELVKSVSHSIVFSTASITGADARPTFLKGPDGTLFNVTDVKQFSSFFSASETVKHASNTTITHAPKPTSTSQKRDLSEQLLRTKSSLDAQWAKGTTISPEEVSSFLATKTFKSGLPTTYSIPTKAPSIFKREEARPSFTSSSASRPTGITRTSISHSAPTGTHTLSSHTPSGTYTAIAPTGSVASKCKIPGACDADFCGTCLYVDADGVSCLLPSQPFTCLM
jgi:hypothetical protein